MVRIEYELFGFICPYFADVFEGCEALEGFEPAAIIVCVDELWRWGGQLVVAGVIGELDALFGEAQDMFVPCRLGQAADAMALQTAMQR